MESKLCLPILSNSFLFLIFPTYFCKICINVIFSHVPRLSEASSLEAFKPYFYISCFFYVCYIPCLSYLACCNHWKQSSCNFLHSPVTSFPLGRNTAPTSSTLFSSTLKLQYTSFTSFAWKNTVLSHTACEDKSMVLPKIEPSFTPKITLLWRKIPRVQWYDLDWILLVGDLHVIGLRCGSGSTGNIWFRPVSNDSNQMLYQEIHFHKEKVSHDSWYRLKHWKCWLRAVK
jgi:hypothetical protein